MSLPHKLTEEASAALDELRAPKELRGALRRYFEQGIETGGFLRAVLENNLHEAVARAASPEAIAALPHLAEWIYRHAPNARHGSPERVREFLEEVELGRPGRFQVQVLAWIVLEAGNGQEARSKVDASLPAALRTGPFGGASWHVLHVQTSKRREEEQAAPDLFAPEPPRAGDRP